ncbi:MAG: alpha/beta hydrolase [Bacteroidales bacterium]|nr:alpha/beta hydrolase [Bacteroidales bacterium]
MKAITFKKGKIHYHISGSGPVLMFLHGYLLTSEIWKEFLDYFSKAYRVICPDLPGHGRSSFSDPLSMELMAESVYALMREEKIDHVGMIGHSMGGYVALAFLKKYPSCLSGLVLLNSHPFSDTPGKRMNREKILSLVRNGKKTLFIREIMKSLFLSEIRDIHRFQEEVTETALSMDPSTLIAITTAMRDRDDLSLELCTTQVPYLWILGSLDKQNPSGELSKLSGKADLPQPERMVTGHMSFLEDPKGLAARVKLFLESNTHSHSAS